MVNLLTWLCKSPLSPDGFCAWLLAEQRGASVCRKSGTLASLTCGMLLVKARPTVCHVGFERTSGRVVAAGNNAGLPLALCDTPEN